jgi:hypothetical protein
MLTVKFLETLGRNPAIGEAEYQTAIATHGLKDAEADCLIGRDATKLAMLLGGRAKMWCAVMSPDKAPAEDEPFLPDEEPEQDPEDI